VGGALDAGLDLGGIEGITALAPALSLSALPAGDPGGSRIPVLLLAIDPAAQAAVVAGSPAEVALPAPLVESPTGPGIGTPEDPIPVLASARRARDGRGWALGDVFGLQVRGKPLWFRVAGLAESFPGITQNVTFAVAPLASVQAAHGGSALRPNRAFASGGPDAGARLQAALATTVTADRVISRHEQFAALHDAPLVGAVANGFGIALVVAAAYAALTVVAVMALDAQRRAREMAYLRTLGLSDRQLVGLTVVEHAPPVVLALAIGVALGLAIVWLLAPGLELAVFIDPAAPVVLRVDGTSVAAVMTMLVVVMVAAVAASSTLARRLGAADALRMGDA
jgi:putative ABC transport system permease protein